MAKGLPNLPRPSTEIELASESGIYRPAARPVGMGRAHLPRPIADPADPHLASPENGTGQLAAADAGAEWPMRYDGRPAGPLTASVTVEEHRGACVTRCLDQGSHPSSARSGLTDRAGTSPASSWACRSPIARAGAGPLRSCHPHERDPRLRAARGAGRRARVPATRPPRRRAWYLWTAGGGGSRTKRTAGPASTNAPGSVTARLSRTAR
jgi:hypothetical protein